MRLHQSALLLVNWALQLQLSQAFVSIWNPPRPTTRTTNLCASPSDEQDTTSNLQRRLGDLQEDAKIQNLVRAALSIPASSDLVSLQLAGAAELLSTIPTTTLFLSKDARTCLVLSPQAVAGGGVTANEERPCLLTPLLQDGHLKPIEAAWARQPLSDPLLLRLNSWLVNRDGSMWDNLPWSQWTVDPSRRNYDAANNPILPKFHLGKRDAYNVMMGKDWFTYSNTRRRPSQAIFLLNQQLKQQQQQNKKAEGQDESVLAQRLLELQIREIEMDIAELDYEIAVLTGQQQQQQDGSSGEEALLLTLEFQREDLLVGLKALQEQLEELLRSEQEPENILSFFSGAEDEDEDVSLLQRIVNLVDSISPVDREAAPYRGATGYAPYQRSTAEEDEPFTSPYDMILDIVQNQLKANVIGCVLENTSLLGGNTVLGGVLVLRRQTAQKKVSIDGQTFRVDDEEEDYGNDGIGGGETFVVECEVDEAVGISLASSNNKNMPTVTVQMEQDLWERCSVMATPDLVSKNKSKLPMWQAVDPELSILLEGQASNRSATERVAPIRIPRTTMLSLYDSIQQQRRQEEQQPSDEKQNLFPTDNPVQSLTQLDQMSDQDKARTLVSMSNFQGERLPRPRTVRQAKAQTNRNPLDELLIPRIDESVRRQYLIRQAEQSGNVDLVRELKQKTSKRQQAMEAAEAAREAGNVEAAARWDQEAKLYTSLRADVTQDEGSYSRFLDRDEWYERERRKHAKKLDKKKFGTLLDGIE